jgi:hypothetical protein
MSQAKGMAFVHLKLSMWASQSDMQLAFRNVLRGGRYYQAKKHIREGLILPELLLDNYPMFLMTFSVKMMIL